MIFLPEIEQQLADNLTFIVTDDCNLRCRYCYQEDKQPNDMSIETALRTADYFFDQYQNKYSDVVFDFIGGEPFVRIDLLEVLLPYLLKKHQNSKKWGNMIFNFSTNGTCFADEQVRKLIAEYRPYMSIGVSLDGVKTIHDYNRGDSFDEVMRWFPYWRQQFSGGATKSTLNSEALPHLFESIKFLTGTCLQHIYMNTVYEDVWKPGDDKLFYDQLILAADYILDNKLYKTKNVSLFSVGLLENIEKTTNWCGSGSCMLAVDYRGDIYPCMRFKSLSKQKPLAIGNIKSGIEYKKLLPFYFCHNLRNTPDCGNCEAQAGCPNCTAFCYDETGSIFDRVSYMCDMHRARKRANEYYWQSMADIEGVTLQDLFSANRVNV
jgi:uncharacterized protein